MGTVAAPSLPLHEDAPHARRGEPGSQLPARPAPLLSGVIWRDALLVWVAQRAFFVLLTFLGESLLQSGAARGVILLWTRWDGLDYAGIASGGYTQPWQAAFSPLLPALARVVALPLGGDTALAALIVANVACLGAFVLIRALAESELGVAAARRALLYLAIFPTAFFLAAAYTESLFLLLSAAAFLAIRAHRWPLAGVFVALAALTRPVGILLLAAVAAEVWTTSPRLRSLIMHPFASLRSLREPSDSAPSAPSAPSAVKRSRSASVNSVSSVVKICSAFALPLAALASFDLYLSRQFGTLAATLDAEQGASWKRALSWPWDAPIRAGSAVLHDQTAHALHAGLDLGFTLLFLALAVAALRGLPLAYGAFAVAMVALVLVTPMTGADWLALGSNSRLLLGTLPLFFALAQWGGRSRRLHLAIVVISLLLLALYTLAWVGGAFVA